MDNTSEPLPFSTLEAHSVYAVAYPEKNAELTKACEDMIGRKLAPGSKFRLLIGQTRMPAMVSHPIVQQVVLKEAADLMQSRTCFLACLAGLYLRFTVPHPWDPAALTSALGWLIFVHESAVVMPLTECTPLNMTALTEFSLQLSQLPSVQLDSIYVGDQSSLAFPCYEPKPVFGMQALLAAADVIDSLEP